MSDRMSVAEAREAAANAFAGHTTTHATQEKK